ncbi:Protein F10G8.9 b [Aphelenchoides avenae]|nr:Protein F10G8.9 b [Aphelenchus avenae]
MPSLHRVVIIGVSAVSPYGVGVDAFWSGLKQSRNPLKYNAKLKAVVGQVPDRDQSSDHGFDTKAWSGRQEREMARGGMFALVAAEEVLKDAGIAEGFDHEETGVNIGMGIADLEMVHDTGTKIDQGQERRVSPFFAPRILTNIPASYVSLKYRMRGGNSSSTTACATGASCIGDAYMHVRMGRIRRVVAGAVESCVNPISVVGFQRMRALAGGDDARAQRSNGWMLERLEDADERKAKIYAEIVGYGLANDAYHMTSPREDGLGSRLCMQRCMQEAGISADEVSYVNAHATSTPVGDVAEAVSIASVLPGVAVSSIKGHIGHCLAAAGSLETVATLLSMKEGVLLPTLNLRETDIDAEVDLVKNAVRPWKANDRRIALMNSFGFGGAFVSLALAGV